MPYTITLTLDEVSRDLAEQYAKGQMSMDEYFDVWEQFCLLKAGIKQ